MRLRHDPRLFEQIVVIVGRRDAALPIEGDLDQLAKSGRVVVTDRLGVAEGLEDRIGLQSVRDGM